MSANIGGVTQSKKHIQGCICIIYHKNPCYANFKGGFYIYGKKIKRESAKARFIS